MSREESERRLKEALAGEDTATVAKLLEAGAPVTTPATLRRVLGFVRRELGRTQGGGEEGLGLVCSLLQRFQRMREEREKRVVEELEEDEEKEGEGEVEEELGML